MKIPEKRSIKNGLKEKKKFAGGKQNRNPILYDSYPFTSYDLVISLGKGLFTGFLILYGFYWSWWITPFLAVFLLFYIKYDRKRKNTERMRKLNYEFRSALQSISSGISSGYSIENAIESTAAELELLFGNTSELCREFQYFSMQIRLNQRVEDLFQNFALRSGSEDIESFGEVLLIAKKTGGDFIRKIDDAADKIQDRIEIREEIQVIMSGKRMEQRIMNMIPPGMLWYLNLSSPGFLQVLYTTVLGRLVMTGCFAVYILAWIWGERIVRIEL